MSIVLNLVTPTTSWLMTDGRGIKNGVVLENIRKSQKLNPWIRIAYTGRLEFAEAAVDALHQNIKNIETAKLEDILQCLEVVTRPLRESREDWAQFLITGVCQSGALGSCTLSTKGDMQKYYPTNAEFKIAALLPNNPIDPIRFITPCPPNTSLDKHIERCMSNAVHHAAALNHSVDTNMSFYIIRQPGLSHQPAKGLRRR